MDSTNKGSAQLEREVEAQRQQIESRIGEIRERLTPGQLIDEVLSYTGTGGKTFASNLGHTVANNPLPTALLGVSLVWLMSGQGPKLAAHGEATKRQPQVEYPYATISGGMRRVGHSADEGGRWYSQFEDNSGRRYKAESNEHGHRVGEFMDDAGRKFGGFIDDAGHRVRDFQDEAGNRLDDAMGWASHTWHDLQEGVSKALGKASDNAQHLGEGAQHQLDKTSRMVQDLFERQPLVAGALAFAAGAALGATLPHTEEEDRVVGQLSDDVKGKAAEAASDAYEEGKARVGEVYEEGKERAGRLYDEGRGKTEEAVDKSPLH